MKTPSLLAADNLTVVESLARKRLTVAPSPVFSFFTIMLPEILPAFCAF